jgi:ABC-type bacteriocin/lantibiotic exporter with double-glycine peptidase domain
VGFLCIDCMEKRKHVNKSILHPSKLLYTFLFLQESNAEKHHPFPHHNKGFINYTVVLAAVMLVAVVLASVVLAAVMLVAVVLAAVVLAAVMLAAVVLAAVVLAAVVLAAVMLAAVVLAAVVIILAYVAGRSGGGGAHNPILHTKMSVLRSPGLRHAQTTPVF